MTKVCEICNQITETNGKQLHLAGDKEELKHEWEVCEDCLPAFSVLDEYFQGQN